MRSSLSFAPWMRSLRRWRRDPANQAVTLEDLRQLALAAAAQGSQAPSQWQKERVPAQRGRARVYVVARANGNCEGCDDPGTIPVEPDGTPYLEPHHLRRLSDGGP